MKKYRCVVCEWIYDPAVGDPDGGIAPGTPFEEIPDDWACPVCGVDKSNFEEVENRPRFGETEDAPRKGAHLFVNKPAISRPLPFARTPAGRFITDPPGDGKAGKRREQRHCGVRSRATSPGRGPSER